MSEYTQIKTAYEYGLITQAEANERISLLNMGSDTQTFPRMR